MLQLSIFQIMFYVLNYRFIIPPMNHYEISQYKYVKYFIIIERS